MSIALCITVIRLMNVLLGWEAKAEVIKPTKDWALYKDPTSKKFHELF